MKRKISIIVLCIAVLSCTVALSACKLNYPEIWYLNVRLNGGTYAEGNPYDYSPNANLMKVVSKTNFENFTMPEPKYFNAPTGKVFAGWYFDDTENDYSFNFTEENWYTACENANKEEEGKRSVYVYAKWVDEGQAVFALDGGSSGTFKQSFSYGNKLCKKINLNDLNTETEFLDSLNVENVFTYPVSKSFGGWYLHVAKNNTETDKQINIENVNEQITNEKSAYFNVSAKWNSRKVFYIEIDVNEKLPEELNGQVRFTDEFFDTRVKELTIGYSGVSQTTEKMIIYVYLDQLDVLADLSGILPDGSDVIKSPTFDRTFDGLYFWFNDKDMPLTLDNLKDYALNRIYDYDEEYMSAYLNWDQKVTFDYNYEGAPQSTVVTTKVNQKLVEPETPTRSGYTFVGWSTESWDGSPMYYGWDFNERVVYGDLTLYAIWIENT